MEIPLSHFQWELRTDGNGHGTKLSSGTCIGTSTLRGRGYNNKMLSYRRETAHAGALVLAKSERLELGDNILLTL